MITQSFTMRHSAVLLATILFNSALFAEPLILTNHPITYQLTSRLVQQTAIKVENTAPLQLPSSRVTAYLTGRGSEMLKKQAADATAVISLRSIWPNDPLYPLVRRHKIKAIEIDAATPIDGALPGIAVLNDEADVVAQQPWMDLINLGRMADIVSADLQRLMPRNKAQIDINLAQFKKELLSQNTQSELELSQIDNLTVLNLSDSLTYLLSSLNLDVLQLPSSLNSTSDSVQIGQFIDAEDIALIVYEGKLSNAMQDAIKYTQVKAIELKQDKVQPISNQLKIRKELLLALKNKQ